jgi:hypothetical protein
VVVAFLLSGSTGKIPPPPSGLSLAKRNLSQL